MSSTQEKPDLSSSLIKEFIDEGALIIFDTSIWLDIYRNLPENILTIIDALKNPIFSNKLFVPSYVKFEFEKRYHQLIAEHKKIVNETNDSLKNIVNDLSLKLRKAIKEKKERYHIHRITKSEEQINTLLNKLNEKVESFLRYDEVQESLSECEVCDEIKKLFEDYATRNIIDALTKNEVLKCIQDGEQRYKNKTPPGYMDEDKVKKTNLYLVIC